MIQTEKMDYQDGDTALEAYVAFDNRLENKRPLVLIVHDWSGRNAFVCKKAEALAELGYVGFAIDMYGKNKIYETNEEKMAAMSPFMEDRTRLIQRVLAAVHAAKKIKQVDVSRIAAMGFCFGGLCVLDLARSDAGVNGVVSFHGILTSLSKKSYSAITAKILVLHGHDDPMVQPDQVLAFEKEMTEAKADWQIHVYGNTKHAFTNPLANDPVLGTVYDAVADARSWVAMKSFFSDLFA